MNAAIALEILKASIQVANRVQEMLAKAAAEKRDITEAELQTLKAGNDVLEQQILDA